MLCQGITVCEGTGAPKTWHNLSLTLGSRQWTMVCQSVLWPATEHCVHLKQAVKPWGCAEDGWVQLYYFPALSIPGQVLSLLESRGISGSRARDASPFLLLPLPSPFSLQIPLPPSLFCNIVPVLQTVLSSPDSLSSPLSVSSPSKWSQAYSCFEEQGGEKISEQLLLWHHSVVCLCVGEEVGECKIICRCTKQYNGNCIIKIL